MDDEEVGSATDEVRATAVLLMAVTERIRAALEAAAARSSLSGTQARALMALGSPTPMGTLAHHLGCDASNVTGLADRLEARGLVVRQSAAGDRRVKALALTARGHRVREELEQAVVAGSPVRAALDPAQRAQLLELLRAVAGDGVRPC